MMKYKKLGKTDTKIPVIGQGCMGIGGYLSQDPSQDSNQIKALRRGIELGMTFIDTAEAYGNGHSEELVGKAVKGIRDKVFVATKFSPEHNSHDDVIKSAEESLRRLKTDYIDLYQVHWPNPKIPLTETIRAMERLLKEGGIRYVGVSNFSLKELREAQATISEGEIVSVQNEYNLSDRSIENSILPYSESEGITTIAYSPLDQGKIASGDKKIKALRMIAHKYDRTTAQVALNWLISHPSVIVIPKATNLRHINENASAADFELSDEDFKEISETFAQECVYVPVDRIRVIISSQGNRQVYQTVEEAVENKLGFVPSPVDLAQDVRQGEVLKPVRLVASTDKTGKYDYDLIEGRIRYWAWVIAHNGKVPIPAYTGGD
jgi:aryl-alcohol dehydrogenase-like predicted oxidoreductase